MELKRILAKDLRKATEKAVALYGKDVLFVSNSRVNGMTEVIVAVEVMPEITDAPADKGKPEQFQAALSRSFKELKNGATATPAPEIDIDDIALPVKAVRPTLHNSENDRASDQRDYIRGREIVDMVRDELTAMRKEFKLAQRIAMWQSPAGANPAVKPLVTALSEAGIPVSLRTLLVDHISEMEDLQQATESLKEQLIKNLGEHHAKMPQSGIHAIAGPAGAGKTMMIAKLAKAAADRKGAESVAVISYCDQRAGAWSQIQMLCAQNGVDCLRANNPETLQTLLSELGTRKLILIDTPGVEVATRTHEIVGCGTNIACHLVLPADASTTTIRKTLLEPTIKWASLMLARTDESTQPWPLIQVLCEHPVALSAASDSPMMTAPLKALSAAYLVGLAIQSLELDNLMTEMVSANEQEQETTMMTAAQALVQRIEKMPHAS